MRTAADDVVIRWIEDGDLPAYHRAFTNGFHMPPAAETLTDDELAYRRLTFTPGRFLGAFDGAACVATFRSIPFELTVPGGAAVAADGISSVTVTATHRRRGLATRMMARELDAARRRGDALAILVAAEYGIYGRFGFGDAAAHGGWTVDTGLAGGLRDGVGRLAPGARIDLAPISELRTHGPALWDRVRSGPGARPGAITRDDRFWDLATGALTRPGESYTAPFLAVHRDAGGAVTGVLAYRVDRRFDDGLADCTLVVRDLITTDAATRDALVRYAAEVDWVRRLTVHNSPEDDAFPLLWTNPRAVRRTADPGENLWLRVLDPAAAFAARRYAAAGRTVLAVRDGLGHVDGTFALETAADGTGSWTKSADAPDLTLDAAQLGSLYLGGHSAVRLAAAGLLTEHTPGAAADLTRRLWTPLAPWCQDGF